MLSPTVTPAPRPLHRVTADTFNAPAPPIVVAPAAKP